MSAAQDLLDDIVGWHLTASRWSRVQAALERLAVALDARDDRAAREAHADLDLLSTPRVVTIGTEPVLPAPGPVRELVRELVHTLGGDPTPLDERFVTRRPPTTAHGPA